MGHFDQQSCIKENRNFRILKFGMITIVILFLSLFFSYSSKQIPFKSNLPFIRVVMDNNYPPYTFLDENGNPQGILIDQWKLWEQRTGIKVYLTTMDWGSALKEMEAGNFDVIDTIFYNEDRARLYSFSAPYADIEVPIYFQNNISGLTTAASLKGFQVGVKAKDNAIDYLRSQGLDQFIEFDSYESIIKAAKDRQLLVFVVDKPPAEYFISKYGIQDDFNSSTPLYTGQFHRAVKKDNQALLSTVENGFKLINPREINGINTKWFGNQLNISVYSKYILVGAGFVALIALLLLVSNRVLQRRVTERTAELNALFGAMQDLVIVTDSSGVCLSLPTKTSPLIPDTFHDIVGRNVVELIPESSGKMIVDTIQRVLRNQSTEFSEYSVSVNGKKSWFSGVVSPLDKKRALLVARDFTQWKNTQEALLESEQRFHIMFENHDVAMVLVSPLSGKVVDSNQAAADFYGYTVDQMRKINVFQFYQLNLEPLRKEIQKAVHEEQTKFVQIHRLANGELRTVEIHCSPVQIGEEDLLFSIIFDISDRKKAEEAVQDKTQELADAYEATLEGWSNALELRERETAGHSKRVVNLTLQICRILNIPDDELIHIQRGALLHDIGKMGIPDNILLKPGPLSPDEWVIMRQHPLYAYRLLSKIPFLKPALDIPYCHHERWDGSGYPQGLMGKDIPLAARVFAIVDVWDALISDRPYRPAWTEDAALKFLQDGSGKLFDAQIVKIFEQIYQGSVEPNLFPLLSDFSQKQSAK